MATYNLKSLYNIIVETIPSKLRIIRYRLHPNIRIGKHCLVEKGVKLSLQYGGSISIGDHCILYRNSMIITHGGDIKIGHHSSVNPYTIIYGQGGTTIGNGVRIAAHCTIVPSNHRFQRTDMPIYRQGLDKKGITIGDDVWIGSGVRILDGVDIASGCVIGAGSVVTKSTVSNGIYVGVPAKLKNIR